ncbi:MAG: hypothetical protein NTX22_01150 [Ignavibacteriales bacterium]|nr:hypothetical protein [Ignavibacteriales bacterium]
MEIQLKIPFSNRLIKKIIISIIILNLIMMIGTYTFSVSFRSLTVPWEHSSRFLRYFLVQFNLATENVIASWYSSMLLLSVSIISIICFWVDRQEQKPGRSQILSFGWLIIALIFAGLSLDEVGSFHERLGHLASLNIFGNYIGGWIYVLVIPIVVVAIFLLIFGLIHLRKFPKVLIFLILGLGFFLLNPILEQIEMNLLHAESGILDWRTHDFNILIEEGMEIFGSFMFILTGIFYVLSIKKSKNLILEFRFEKEIAKKITIGLLILLTLSLGLADTFINYFPIGDTGIAHNWFPSAAAFIVFILSLILFQNSRLNNKRNSFGFLLLGICSLFLSAYFGAYLYPYLDWDRLGVFRFISKGVLIVFVVANSNILMKEKVQTSKFYLSLWMILLSVGIILGQIYVVIAGYTGFIFLLYYLIIHRLSSSGIRTE